MDQISVRDLEISRISLFLSLIAKKERPKRVYPTAVTTKLGFEQCRHRAEHCGTRVVKPDAAGCSRGPALAMHERTTGFSAALGSLRRTVQHLNDFCPPYTWSCEADGYDFQRQSVLSTATGRRVILLTERPTPADLRLPCRSGAGQQQGGFLALPPDFVPPTPARGRGSRQSTFSGSYHRSGSHRGSMNRSSMVFHNWSVRNL
jgi:hypothetical protein